MKVKRIAILLIITVLLGLVARKLFFQKDETGGAGKGPGTPPPAVLSGVVAQRAPSEISINVSGTLWSSEQVVLHPEMSGKVISLAIQEGSNVPKGALLLKLNDDELQATGHKLQKRLELARQRLERQKSLLDAKAIGQEEYDISANEVDVLVADLDYNSALIRKTEIRAPFAGKIGLRNVSEGSFVTPATEVAVLHQLNPLKLDFSIPERYANQIQSGDKIKFTVAGLDETFTARLYAVEPMIDPATRTVKMRASVTNTSGKLIPGAFAKINFDLGVNETILIPTQAVIPVLKGKKVFVCKSGMAISRPVKTGERRSALIEVLDGLLPGDTVITSGIMQLRDSMQVQLRINN